MIQTEKYTFPTPNRGFFCTFPMQNRVNFYTFPISLPHPHENQRWGGHIMTALLPPQRKRHAGMGGSRQEGGLRVRTDV